MTSVDRIQGLSGSLAVKAPVRAATAGAIALSGEQTVDGVAVVEGNRVLVKNQTDTTENGIYNVSTGAWTRALDFDGANDFVQATAIVVQQGSANAGSMWKVTTASPAVGSALAFDKLTPGDADTVEFTQGGTGATTRSAQDKLRERVSVKDFGAVGDGVADDTAEIQAAIDACQGTGAEIFFPRGSYKISSTLNITGAISLRGESRPGVTITWTSTSLTAFSVVTNSQVLFSDMTFIGPVSAVSGHIISLTGTTQNLYSAIVRCTFSQGYNHFVTLAAADWLVQDCIFSEYVAYGIYVSNTYNIDAGDSLITGCTMSTSVAGGTGILQVSSGGLKVQSNKILGGSYAYRMALGTAGTATVDLLMCNNSIENQEVAAIHFSRPSGSVVFGTVVISGNQIAGLGTAKTTDWAGIQTDAVAGWLSRVTITGNNFFTPVGGGTPVFTCISIGSTNDFFIGANHCIASPNAGGSVYGIAVGAGATNGRIGVNAFGVYSTGAWTGKLDNGAPASVLVSKAFTQSGTVSATCSTASASLYLDSEAVTFPVAFDSAPVVHCSPNTVGGGVAAWPLSITETGFTLVVVSVTNGGTGLAAWDAQGVL